MASGYNPESVFAVHVDLVINNFSIRQNPFPVHEQDALIYKQNFTVGRLNQKEPIIQSFKDCLYRFFFVLFYPSWCKMPSLYTNGSSCNIFFIYVSNVIGRLSAFIQPNTVVKYTYSSAKFELLIFPNKKRKNVQVSIYFTKKSDLFHSHHFRQHK